jgi:hypothetical protein
MKKYIIISIFFHFLATTCQGQQTNITSKWTLKEVKMFAQKYNLQDSITETKNTALLKWDKTKIDEWCQNWVKAINERNQIEAYFRDTEKVKSRADYFKLLDSYPVIKEKIVNNHGGKEGYEKFREDALKTKCRIYRNSKGALAFRPTSIPISPEEQSLGKRVDNLAKD